MRRCRRSSHRSRGRTREALLDAGVAVAEAARAHRPQRQSRGRRGRVSPRAPSTSTSTTARRSSTRSTPASTPGSRRRSARRPRGCRPAPSRIVRGVEAYLDTCLADRAVKALALEARSDPGLAATMSARHERFAASAVPSFKAMGWPDADRRLAPARGDDRRDRDPRARCGPPPARGAALAAPLPRGRPSRRSAVARPTSSR